MEPGGCGGRATVPAPPELEVPAKTPSRESVAEVSLQIEDVDVAARVADGAQEEREALLVEAEHAAASAAAITPSVGAFSSASVQELSRPGRVDDDNKARSHILSICFVVTMVVALGWSIAWGVDDGVSGEKCSKRMCEQECEDDRSRGCTWCPGPDLSMPGYCEETPLINAFCNPAALGSNCTARAAWDECAYADESACNNASACEWCGGRQQSCVPGGTSSAPPNGSYCLNTGAPNDTSPVLSSAHPACETTWSDASISPDHRRRRWIDLSAVKDRSSAVGVLAANHTYHTQLSCIWSFECSFNETVELTVQHVNLDYNAELIIFDGQKTQVAGQLAYFARFSGNRHDPDNNNSVLATAVSGSPSSHLLVSTGPVMTVKFTSGGTDAQMNYSQHTGNIGFPGTHAHDGFYIEYKCGAPKSFYGRAGFYLLGVWALAIIWFLRKAHLAIRYSAKTGGLWKMNTHELCTLCEAMDQTQPPPDPQTICKGELIARITQSDKWPEYQTVQRLALSSFDDLGTDNSEEWVDVSWHSPYFLTDCLSCFFCTVEGFTDMLFLVMQLYRPDGLGFKTAILALMITLWSTFMYLSPPGKGLFSTIVFPEKLTFHDAKTWVWKYARTPDGDRLKTREDWFEWLHTPAGKHRHPGLGSELHNEYAPWVPESVIKVCLSSKKDDDFDKGWTSYAQFLSKKGVRAEADLVAKENRSSRASERHEPFLGSLFSQVSDSATHAAHIVAGGAARVVTTAAHKMNTQAEAMLPHAAHNAVAKVGAATNRVVGGLAQGGATVVGGVVGGVGHGVATIGRAAKRKVGRAVGLKEEKGSEPGWLCGQPPQNKWDRDDFQLVYGRPSTPLMYILTVLQCRVAVEGMITWRNIATLRAKRTKAGLGNLEVTKVKEKEFERARRNLDMALLREGIFEALPQSVLEFQNLFRDKYAVLDLMSIPGVPVLTNISEYQLTFAIMLVTIFTATLDITTPYSTDSLSVGISLYVSQLLQLWSRLLVFGSVLSMHKESEEEDSNGLVWGACYMLATYLLTTGWYCLSESQQWFHDGEASVRQSQEKVAYGISIRTAEGDNTGTSATVSISLKNDEQNQSWSKDDKLTIGKLVNQSVTGERVFEPGANITVSHDATFLETITDLEVELSKPSESWRCSEVEIKNHATRTSYRFDTSKLVWGKGGNSIKAEERGITQEYAVTVRSTRTGTQRMQPRVQIKFCHSNDWHTLDQRCAAQNVSMTDSDAAPDLPVLLKVSPPIKAPLTRIELRLESGHGDEGHAMHCESVELFDFRSKQTHFFPVDEEITHESVGFAVSSDTGPQGMDMLNMQAASRAENVLLFSAINLFTCTDKNLCTPPTSKAAFMLSFARIVESAVVCAGFVPFVCFISNEECDCKECDPFSVDRVSAFEIKSFLSVYLAVCSFACLLAGAAAEKLGVYTERKQRLDMLEEVWTRELTPEHRSKLGTKGLHTLDHFQRMDDIQILKACGFDVGNRNAQAAARGVVGTDDAVPIEGAQSRCIQQARELSKFCQHWKSHVLFLYTLLPLLLVVIILCGVTLFYVYVKWMTECRSVVMMSLTVAFGVIIICIRLARGKEKVRLITQNVEAASVEHEVLALLALLAIIFVGAFLLGLSGRPALGDDLGSNPFNVLSSRCHRGDAWRALRGLARANHSLG